MGTRNWRMVALGGALLPCFIATAHSDDGGVVDPFDEPEAPSAKGPKGGIVDPFADSPKTGIVDPFAEDADATKLASTLVGTYAGASDRKTIRIGKGCTWTDEQRLTMSVDARGRVEWKGYSFADTECLGQRASQPFSCWSSGTGTLLPIEKPKGSLRLVLVVEGHAAAPTDDPVGDRGAALTCSAEWDQSWKSLASATVTSAKDSLRLPVATAGSKYLVMKKVTVKAPSRDTKANVTQATGAVNARANKKSVRPSDSRDESKAPATPAIQRDSGCPVAARRFIKKMTSCGLDSDGITEEMLCSKTDTQTIRFMSKVDSCEEFLRLLKIGD